MVLMLCDSEKLETKKGQVIIPFCIAEQIQMHLKFHRDYLVSIKKSRFEHDSALDQLDRLISKLDCTYPL